MRLLMIAAWGPATEDIDMREVFAELEEGENK